MKSSNLSIFAIVAATLGPFGGCARSSSTPPPASPPPASPPTTAALPTPAAATLSDAAPAAPRRYPRLVLDGDVAARVEVPGEGTAQFYGAIFLGDDLAKTDEPLYLYLDGVVAEMGTEAEVYLSEPSIDRIEPSYYTGSLANVAANRRELGSISQEVHDFEADGVRFRARSALREMRSFAVALLVKQGAVSVRSIVLTTEPPAHRHAR
ncbi:MAG: hypothetical protein RIT45_3077 [Pseudomonadota bacterium]